MRRCVDCGCTVICDTSYCNDPECCGENEPYCDDCGSENIDDEEDES